MYSQWIAGVSSQSSCHRFKLNCKDNEGWGWWPKWPPVGGLKSFNTGEWHLISPHPITSKHFPKWQNIYFIKQGIFFWGLGGVAATLNVSYMDGFHAKQYCLYTAMALWFSASRPYWLPKAVSYVEDCEILKHTGEYIQDSVQYICIGRS